MILTIDLDRTTRSVTLRKFHFSVLDFVVMKFDFC